MLFISETESAALVTHELAFAAVREALVAACDGATVSFPAVLGHGSSTANRFSIKSAATPDLAGLKVGSYWPGKRDRGLARKRGRFPGTHGTKSDLLRLQNGD